MSISSSPLKRLGFIAALAPVALLAGCANMVGTAPEGNSLQATGKLTGSLHGGNQPIIGAAVSLYYTGTSGYGSAGTIVATVSSDNSGSFSFTQIANTGGSIPTNGVINSSASTYACPTSADPLGVNAQMYVIASGGSTTGLNSPTNKAAVFVLPLGACSAVAAKFVDLNEVTTVAGIAAAQQYFGATRDSFGYAATAQSKVGYINAVATIDNLANTATGVAIASKTLTGAGSTVNGTAITLTPESTKINTLANTLAACVNTASAGSDNCNTLFTNAVPPSPAVTSQPDATFSAANDTAEAAYYMLINPTNGSATNLTNLYNLGAADAPFQPTLSAAPSDWTVGIFYLAGSQVGTTAPGNTPNACTGTAAAGAFIFYPYLIRSDANGNIWMVSNHAASTTTGQEPSISALSPTGVPLACVQPGATQGAFEGLTIDTAGNIWAAAHVTGGGIFKINPNTLATTAWTETGVEPWDIQADGSGNVFYSVASAPIRKFTGAATAATATAATAIGTASNSVQNYMVLDFTGNLYVADNGSGTLFETYKDASGTNGYSTYAAGTSGNVQAQLAVDASGKIWSTQTSTVNTATAFTPATPPATGTSVASATAAGGMNAPRGVAFDGAGNAWIPSSVSGGKIITELDKNLNALSPSTGFVKPSFTQTMRGATVDPSGNVWFADNVTTQSVIQEIVGAGVPVVTPLSAQLAAGTVAKP